MIGRWLLLGFGLVFWSVSPCFDLLAKDHPKADNFVSLKDLDTSIVVEARYFGANNFVGKLIDGYKANQCLLTKQAAQALVRVQKDLRAKNLSLKVYDCYRPQKAVDHFVRWAKDLDDQKMKNTYYPNVDKKNLFRDGYIADKSGHSRGSTVDLTIVTAEKSGQKELDMGSPWDFFDPLSHTDQDNLMPRQKQNRHYLKSIMEKHGFQNYPKEWWHYTLENEPYPETYFDFDVK